MNNLYSILNLSKDASTDDIRKSYRLLSKKYHPDNKETGDVKIFLEIKVAYDTLFDEKSREFYDKTGITLQGGNNQLVKDCEQAIAGFINQWVDMKTKNNTMFLGQNVSLGVFLTSTFEEGIKRTSSNIKVLNKEVLKADKLLKNVKFSGDGVNIAEVVISDRIKALQLNLNAERHKLEIFKLGEVSSKYYSSPEESYGHTTSGSVSFRSSIFTSSWENDK
jgi:curved DNA-binding protein CbpA